MSKKGIIREVAEMLGTQLTAEQVATVERRVCWSDSFIEIQIEEEITAIAWN